MRRFVAGLVWFVSCGIDVCVLLAVLALADLDFLVGIEWVGVMVIVAVILAITSAMKVVARRLWRRRP